MENLPRTELSNTSYSVKLKSKPEDNLSNYGMSESHTKFPIVSEHPSFQNLLPNPLTSKPPP